ncbi:MULTISPECIES: hypothetical protein [unclassified Roseibium]|uniref:hypothetical protein n=1 Tax=unclassified Roseibium TaxID=2629323 RepID=UPI003177F835
MSEQTSHHTQFLAQFHAKSQAKAADAQLVNLYKPVGIAAINAVALCRKPEALPKKGK